MGDSICIQSPHANSSRPLSDPRAKSVDVHNFDAALCKLRTGVGPRSMSSAMSDSDATTADSSCCVKSAVSSCDTAVFDAMLLRLSKKRRLE